MEEDVCTYIHTTGTASAIGRNALLECHNTPAPTENHVIPIFGRTAVFTHANGGTEDTLPLVTVAGFV